MLSPRIVPLVCFALLSAVGSADDLSAREERSVGVLIRNVPHVRQKPDFCGEACAEMYLRKLGYQIDQDAVFDQSGLDPLLGRGCYTRDLAQALKTIGFEIGPAWFKITAAEATKAMNDQFRKLHDDLRHGIPSIICMHYDDRPETTEHFRLILGYDPQTDEILYHEPAVDKGDYRRMKRELLLKLWPLKYSAREWTVIRMPLLSARISPRRSASERTDADFAQHIMQLKKRIPNRDFHFLIQKPFVVIGDEDPETVRHRSEKTIKWAVDHLKREYFNKDPNHIIDIWLFKDKKSYETHTEKLFGDTPSTPYGYYTSRHRALIMNIATGGGTLVHEIVHPFIESNFPECPSWFNEGLASLYEQCGEQEGKIHGYTNWRLGGLQQAARRDRIPAFNTLMSTSTFEFYEKDPGTNYAQARYLCYYLQQQGLLRKYYREFRSSVADDPTGYQSLKKVLGRDDTDKFQQEWQKDILTLRQ